MGFSDNEAATAVAEFSYVEHGTVLKHTSTTTLLPTDRRPLFATGGAALIRRDLGPHISVSMGGVHDTGCCALRLLKQ